MITESPDKQLYDAFITTLKAFQHGSQENIEQARNALAPFVLKDGQPAGWRADRLAVDAFLVLAGDAIVRRKFTITKVRQWLYEHGYEDPVTGVADANNYNEEIYDEIVRGRDLGWEEHRKECKDDDCDHDVGGRVLLGGWKKTWVWRDQRGREYEKKPANVECKRKLVWEPDETTEYSALYNKDQYTIQVVWSRHTALGQWCSPCYPNQASIPQADDDSGFVLLYTLPPNLLGESAMSRQFNSEGHDGEI